MFQGGVAGCWLEDAGRVRLQVFFFLALPASSSCVFFNFFPCCRDFNHRNKVARVSFAEEFMEVNRLWVPHFQVVLKVEAATDGSSTLPGFVPKTLEFVAGDGDVCDALECVMDSKWLKQTLRVPRVCH